MAAQFENLTKTAAFFGVSRMTINRWRSTPSVGFPKPIMINGRPYIDVKERAEWAQQQKLKSGVSSSAAA